MLDIGWSEMAVIGLLALLVIGPKDLPGVMRTVGKYVRKARGLAREFQGHFDDMAREADLEDAKKAVNAARNFDVQKMAEATIDPEGEISADARDLARDVKDDQPAAAAPSEPRIAPPDGEDVAAKTPEPETAAEPAPKRRRGGAAPSVDDAAASPSPS